MSSLLVLDNPKPRRRKKSARKMSAAQRKYFGGGVRTNPKRKRRRKAHAHHIVARSNPKRRRHRHKKLFARVRRNPRMLGGGKMDLISSHISPAGIGAAGALVNDIAVGYIKPHLPDSLQTDTMATLVKVGFALAIGYGAEKVVSKALARQATVGALTVALHEALRTVVSSAVPSLQLGEQLSAVDYFQPGMGQQLSWSGMGELVGPVRSSMMSPQSLTPDELQFGSHNY